MAADLVQGIIAGGYEACYRAVEASEDDRAAGGRDLDSRGVTGRDAVVGIAASGRTPYTLGALERARQLGAFTAAVTCVPGSPITQLVDVPIVPVVGPEVVTGSTRMKAGTAQKLVLNMLSTASLIRLGYVTGNRMTNMRARNSKLHARSLRILMAETGLDEPAAAVALEAAGLRSAHGHCHVTNEPLTTGRGWGAGHLARRDRGCGGDAPRAGLRRVGGLQPRWAGCKPAPTGGGRSAG